jgi:hypothetical protein
MEEFIYNLNSDGIVNTPIIPENKIKGITNFLKALLFLIPPIYFMYKIYFKKEKKDFKSINEINDYINEKEKSSAVSKIIQGIVFIIFGIRLYFFFKPDKSQISLGILIKYLQKKNIISDSFYKILKKLKPEGMSKYGE